MVAHLKLLIAKLKHDRFGASSERGRKLLDQMELEELGATASEAATVVEKDSTPVKAFGRRKPDEIAQSVSFALQFEGRKQVRSADNLMAEITAERLVRHLERSGFVLMKRPPGVAPSTEGMLPPRK